MKYFTRSLLDYLKTLCHPVLKNPNTHELRIFLASFPPAIVNEVGRELSDYWLKSKRDINFQFKVGHKLWQRWKEAGEAPQILDALESAGWVDLENRLTHYRNMEWRPDSQKDGLVVMLVGVELATDQGSLEDFYRVDRDTIWNEQMGGRFANWLTAFLYDHQIDPDKTHLAQMEALLETLRKNAVGDLIRISEFLESINLSGALDSHDALDALYGQLSFWGLPLLSQMKTGKWGKYVDTAIDFFSYQKYFKETERNKALKKIEKFRSSAKENDVALDLQNQFSSQDDLLNCLSGFIETKDPKAEERLLKFDFAIIKDEILDYKEPKSNGDADRKGFKALYGAPLEVVLTALWETLVAFQARCTKGKKKPRKPSEVLKGIHLKGLKFVDYENNNHPLALGLLGGLDAFLEEQLGQLSLDIEEEETNIPFSSQLLPWDEALDEPNLSFGETKVGTPNFQFEVLFEGATTPHNVRLHFKWSLPETDSYRNLWEMARVVCETPVPEFWLPTYHIRYYRELFYAPDETEVHRVLRAGLSELAVNNLLENLEGIDKEKLVRLGIRELTVAYNQFLKTFVDKGYFSALRGQWIDDARLMDKYKDVGRRLIQEAEFEEFRPLVYKAFLLTEKPTPEDKTNFTWQAHVPNAAVTGLHPALLDMLNHRETFLAHAWCQRAEFFLRDDTGLKPKAHAWLDILDLATINYPLFGLVAQSSGTLDTRVASYGQIHLIGKPEAQSGPLSSKILQQYETPEEEDIKDAALFRQTRESRVISNILKEYTEVYPHAEDGIHLAVLNPAHIQAIIAGVDVFLNEKLKKDRGADMDAYPPYHFSLSLFMEVAESGEVSRWLSEWQKRWDPAQGASRYEYYQHCRLSVSQKVITQPKDYGVLLKSDATAIDIAVLTRFMDSQTPDRNFEKTHPFKPDFKFLLNFPVLEMPRCEENRLANRTRRSRIISNRRFQLAALHAELSVRLSELNTPPDHQHVILSRGDYSPWAEIVDQMHQNASWVLCLDPSMDERLVQKDEKSGAGKPRQIIGFSSGVGAHGELNYTLSTERSTLLDVQKMIETMANNLFGPWPSEETREVARILVREARKLSGLSLVRATGRGRKIHDLIAFALVRHCLPKTRRPETRLCDELVVLDDFPHWFENTGGEREMFPDLLRVQAFLGETGQVLVDAHLVECKLSDNPERYVPKAREQLANGLRHLIDRFQPKGRGKTGLGFDQRYWWAQLQRLIANKALVDKTILEDATAALESLGEGNFQIHWDADILAIWTHPTPKVPGDGFQCSEERNFQWGNHEIKIPVISCNGQVLLRLAGSQERVVLPMADQGDSEPLEMAETPPAPGPEASSPAPPAAEAVPEAPPVSEPSDSDRPLPSEMPAKPPSAPEETGPSPVPEESKKSQAGEVSPESTPPDPEPVPKDPAPSEEESPKPVEIPSAAQDMGARPFPERVFLGKTDPGRDIYWEYGHPELTNRHILVFGASGAGKTYAIQALLMELGLQGQNSVVIDYTNGFLPDHLETEFQKAVIPATHLVRQKPLPINPFRPLEQRISGFDPLPEGPHEVGARITTVINSVYSNVGEQQRAVLSETIADGLEEEGEQFQFSTLLEKLKTQGNPGLTLANKLAPFVRMNLFRPDGTGNWERLYADPDSRANILQLAGVARQIAQIATEFILWDLYDFASNSGRKDRPLPIVLDEIQNLDHRLEAPLGKFLTEGRKFGLSLILATQTLSNLKADEKDRLFQASHKLFFMPAATEMKEYAKILEQSSDDNANTWINRLNQLTKGECYSLGPALKPETGELENKIFKIKITALPERSKGMKPDE